MCNIFINVNGIIQGCSVLIQTDNTTTMFYLNRQEETASSSLCQEAMAVWAGQNKNTGFKPSISLQTRWADMPSRTSSFNHEWSIRDLDSIFTLRLSRGGPVCYQDELRGSWVLLHGWESARYHWGCIADHLEGHTILCIPVLPIYQDFRGNQKGRYRHDHSGSFLICQIWFSAFMELKEG